jgi:hypothetical protein
MYATWDIFLGYSGLSTYKENNVDVRNAIPPIHVHLSSIFWDQVHLSSFFWDQIHLYSIFWEYLMCIQRFFKGIFTLAAPLTSFLRKEPT